MPIINPLWLLSLALLLPLCPSLLFPHAMTHASLRKRVARPQLLFAEMPKEANAGETELLKVTGLGEPERRSREEFQGFRNSLAFSLLYFALHRAFIHSIALFKTISHPGSRSKLCQSFTSTSRPAPTL